MITMENFIGNDDLKQLLRISIEAAKTRNTALPHILLKGPSGTGKTTLAEAIAKEFGTKPIALTPGTAKKAENLRKLFLRMPGQGYDEQGKIVGKIRPQIVFSDEVHQLPLVAQENLGIAMQDWKLPVHVHGKDVFEWVPRFTLIGATTLSGKLSKPFLDRFKIQTDFETYSHDEAMSIANGHAERQGLVLEAGVSKAIAQRSRGVARLIVRYVDTLHDAAVVAGKGHPGTSHVVELDMAELMFKQFLKVDDLGLTKADIKVLKLLHEVEEPVGLSTLAAIANEDAATIEKSLEPYLIQEGLLIRTKRGRLITDAGRRYLIAAGHVNRRGDSENSGRLMGES